MSAVKKKMISPLHIYDYQINFSISLSNEYPNVCPTQKLENNKYLIFNKKIKVQYSSHSCKLSGYKNFFLNKSSQDFQGAFFLLCGMFNAV